MSEIFRTKPPGMTKSGELLPVPAPMSKAQAEARIKELEESIRLKEGLPFKFGWKWYPWARAWSESTNKVALLCAANQISKALHVNCLVPTPDGFVKMGDLRVGDFVFDQRGLPTKIVDIPYVGTDEAYELEFSDGSIVVASGDHEWISKGPEERFRKTFTSRGGRKWANPNYNKWQVFSTDKIATNYSPGATPPRRFVIPVCGPAQLPDHDLFDPYYVGLNIGNGSERAISFNALDTDLAEYCSKYGNKRPNNEKLVVGISQDHWHWLCVLGLNVLSYDKKIPEEYMFGSVEQRKALLAGLVDTDGTCAGQNYNYCTTSEVLAQQVLELVCSLGCIGQIKKYPSYYYKKDTDEKIMCKDHYVVTFWSTFNPFRSRRKAAKWRENSRYKHERVLVSVTPVGSRRMKCITVEASDGSFLCTKNYLVTHNSSTQIRTAIDWATNPEKWEDLWGKKPTQFWYLYPTKTQINQEWLTKWFQFMPANEFKEDPVYGWSLEKVRGDVVAIHFHSGVHIYFKSYAQDTASLQTGTCDAVFLDEELPMDHYDELKMRISASNGYFRMVFTATLGQDFWRRALEPGDQEIEECVGALKMTISLYDAMFYEDGTPSIWTNEAIARVRSNCSTEQEVLKRVYGKFIVIGGRVVEAFDIKRHVKEHHAIPPSWHWYAAVDPGSGGENGHPAGIVFVAVRPDFRAARVPLCWRGDKIQTTAGDVFKKYVEMKKEAKILVTQAAYDWACKDFEVIATRNHESFTKAEKSHEIGEQTVNTLFKYDVMYLYENPEVMKLAGELATLKKETAKKNRKDNLYDPLRYACNLIPFDWSFITNIKSEYEEAPLERPRSDLEQQIIDRRAEFSDIDREEQLKIEDEIAEANEDYGGY